ncbi:MAG: hypothetical protein LC790_01990, partial [Actinobacteria bacterium]|nr:hypothetical protein [Actinomycetota bacterium]MCA1697724.1 hypothetical protein [Actinomycetota bacterium]
VTALQGLIANPQKPRQAALRRLQVGAPRAGWYPKAGFPPWSAPDLQKFVEQDLAKDIVAPLHEMLHKLHYPTGFSAQAPIPLCHASYRGLPGQQQNMKLHGAYDPQAASPDATAATLSPLTVSRPGFDGGLESRILSWREEPDSYATTQEVPRRAA